MLTRKLTHKWFIVVKLKLSKISDHRYALFVVYTIQFFPHADLSPDYITRVTRLVSLEK